MTRLSTILMLLAATFLAACSTGLEPFTESGEIPEANTIANNVVDGFTATITGFRDTTVTATGNLSCESQYRADNDVYLLSSNRSLNTNSVNFIVPVSIAAGEYDLSSDEITTIYYGRNLISEEFSENVSGTLEITEINPEANGIVVGNFEFTAENGDGETVTVSGEFDFRAAPAAFASCAGTE